MQRLDGSGTTAHTIHSCKSTKGSISQETSKTRLRPHHSSTTTCTSKKNLPWTTTSLTIAKELGIMGVLSSLGDYCT